MSEKHMKRLRRLNTTECLWVYILKILSTGERHAYILRKEIESKFGFRPGTVTAYKVLYDLQKMGLVEKRKEGMKRIYKITGKGFSELAKASAFYQNLSKDLS